MVSALKKGEGHDGLIAKSGVADCSICGIVKYKFRGKLIPNGDSGTDVSRGIS